MIYYRSTFFFVYDTHIHAQMHILMQVDPERKQGDGLGWVHWVGFCGWL